MFILILIGATPLTDDADITSTCTGLFYLYRDILL